MKKWILIAIFTFTNLMAMASSPKLACEIIFDELDLYDPSLFISIMERKDQTSRSLTFKNKPELLKKIQKAIKIDKEKAVTKSLISDEGEISETIVIINDDEEIKIGLHNDKSKEVYFFMQCTPKKNQNASSNPSKAKRNNKQPKNRHIK